MEEKKKERETEEKKRDISAGRDSADTISAFFNALDGDRAKFNAISRYIIPIILSRVIARQTYGRAFIFGTGFLRLAQLSHYFALDSY